MKSIVTILSRYMLALCMSSIFIFGGITVYFMVSDYKKDLAKLESTVYGDIENSLLKETSRIHNFIEFSINNSRTQTIRDIKSFILEAHKLSDTLYTLYKGKMPDNELKKLIKETLRAMVHQYEDSYLFVVGMNGIEQLNSDHPELENEHLSQIQTPDGRFVIQEMIKLISVHQEGFIDYLWTRPGSDGAAHEKKSYIKLFKPYGWIIGTGIYQETIKKEVQQEVLNRLSRLNTGKDSYIFAGTYSGLSLLGPDQGKDVLNFKDADGNHVVRNLIATAKSGGGFLTYTLQDQNNSSLQRQMSYSTSIPEWKWYIGTGISINNYEKELEIKKETLNDDLLINLAPVCALLIIFSLASLLVGERFKKLLSDNFSSFESFFRKSTHTPVKIDRSKIAFKEFDEMALLANTMIDSRESAKDDLLKSEITYREIFNATQDAIAVMDLDKKVFTDVNQAFLDFFGMDRSEAIGISPEEISFNTPPYDGRAATKLFRKAQNGETVHFEWMVKKGSGQPFWTDNLARVATIGGQKKLLIVMRDITERKKMQKIMIQTEKMMSVGGLAAGMAHEINNPLGVIMQVTQNIIRRTSPTLNTNLPVARQCEIDLDNLRNYMDKRGITNYLHNIQDAGQRAAAIVRSMLDFSRKSNSAKSSCNIESVIETAISLASNDYDLKKQYDFKKIKIIRDYSSPPMFNFTEMEISQVILNLIKNAAQALSEEQNMHKVPTITIRTSMQQQSVKVEIEDNGPGVPEEHMKRIFEPFYSTKSPGSGTGLGLSVSYFIITQNHGGTITMDSSLGEGTRFTITLPMF